MHAWWLAAAAACAHSGADRHLLRRLSQRAASAVTTPGGPGLSAATYASALNSMDRSARDRREAPRVRERASLFDDSADDQVRHLPVPAVRHASEEAAKHSL